MSENDLEGLIKFDEQFNKEMWKIKVMISREDYMNETLRISKEYFEELKPNIKLLNKYSSHESFESYLFRHEKVLDKLLSNINEDNLFNSYIIGLDARIGLLKDKEDIFESKFFTVNNGEEKMFYTIPRILFEKYDAYFNNEILREKENEGMYI